MYKNRPNYFPLRKDCFCIYFHFVLIFFWGGGGLYNFDEEKSKRLRPTLSGRGFWFWLRGGGKIKTIVAEGNAAAAVGGATRRRGGRGLKEGCSLPQENFY